ncbi:hypothetical protein GCM10028805_50630 [Spirosoma harenae]
MKQPFLLVSILLIFIPTVVVFGQRQEISISPVGLLNLRYQLVHYEHYLDTKQSLTFSLGYNGHDNTGRNLGILYPPRTDRFTNSRLAIGYRYYIPGLGIGNDLKLFVSARAVVDYSNLQLSTDSRYTISPDSLKAGSFSLAPELLFGGKVTFLNRITLSGAVGGQYLFKLFSTQQITQNQPYWDAIYWTNDGQDWQRKRSATTHFRQEWYPSVQITLGVILGKRSRLVD